MRVLAITKLFPNRAQPLAGAFNRQQFAALSRECQLEVIATLPWFPGARALSRWTDAGRLGSVPRTDRIDGVSVRHPRLLYLPKLHGLAGALCVGSLLGDVLPRRGEVDVILGSWAYPHGVAAVVLARLLGVPAVIKLHGSDINVLSRQAGPRAHLSWGLGRAHRVVAVSRALAERAIELGATRDRVDVVLNGVDGARFYPRDRAEARRQLGRPLGERLVLYVGWLNREKGVLDLIEGFARARREVPDAALAIVGSGAVKDEAAERAAVVGNVTLAGALPLDDVARWMAACDVLALPSWAEGTPNVLLEALASGRRVIGSDVGGIPDVIRSDAVGSIVPARDIAALERALVAELRRDYDPAEVARVGSPGTWTDSARALLRSLEAAIHG